MTPAHPSVHLPSCLAACLFLVSVLAGCSGEAPKSTISAADAALSSTATVQALAGPPPQERYVNATLQDLDFVSSDGTRLRATVYLPAEPRPGVAHESVFGTIVHLSPFYMTYIGDTDSRMNAVHAGKALNQTGLFGILVAHGFAFVAASIPGTGYSTGCFDFGGQHEQVILAEFVDWVGQQPWSNGNVGLFGQGYPSAAQWMTAIQQPQHLKTIVPHITVTDWYSMAFQDGAPFFGADFVSTWEGAYSYGVDGGDLASGRLPYVNPLPDMLAHRLCPSVADHLFASSRSFATGVYDAFWQERDYTRHLDQIRASVFLVQGLQDWAFKPSQSLVWDGIQSEKAFWLQQMGGYGPESPTPGLNKTWVRPDFNKTLVAWYDHYLNDAANGIPETLPPVQVQDQTGYWRQESRWPPATVEHILFLGSATLLEEAPTAGQTIFVTPADAQGPADSGEETLPARDAPDALVAKFFSKALEHPLRFSGEARLNLSLSVDRPGYGHVVAELWRIQTNGTWEFLTLGGMGLAQRDGRDQDDPPQALEPLRVPLRFQAADVFIGVGERLALTISGENRWFEANGHAPTFILQHGSTLTLPQLAQETPRGIETAAMTDQNPYRQRSHTSDTTDGAFKT